MSVLLWVAANWRIIGLSAVAAGVIGYHIYAVNAAYDRGHANALETVAAANREADKEADAGEDAVAICYRSGGRWLRANGQCQPPVRDH